MLCRLELWCEVARSFVALSIVLVAWLPHPSQTCSWVSLVQLFSIYLSKLVCGIVCWCSVQGWSSIRLLDKKIGVETESYFSPARISCPQMWWSQVAKTIMSIVHRSCRLHEGFLGSLEASLCECLCIDEFLLHFQCLDDDVKCFEIEARFSPIWSRDAKCDALHVSGLTRIQRRKLSISTWSKIQTVDRVHFPCSSAQVVLVVWLFSIVIMTDVLSKFLLARGSHQSELRKTTIS